MQTTNDFLDMLKARRGLASDYAVAKFLGCSPSRISNYRSKRSHFGDDEAILMAELLEIDPAYVLANIHAERAKDEVQKRVWKDLVKRLGGTAAALLLVVCVFSEKPAYADGVTIDREKCILCQIAQKLCQFTQICHFRWLRRFLDFLAFFGLSLRSAPRPLP